MILHLLFDDKFGEYALRQFSGEEMCSEFVIVVNSNVPDCSHKFEKVKVVFEDKEEFQALLQSLGKYKAIVIHGLFYPWQERVLQAVPDDVKVAWVFWGGDIYGRKDIADNYLSSSSKWLLRKQNLKRLIRHRKVHDRYDIPFDLLKRIDYCLTDIPEDFEFVKRYLDSDIKELWYNYYSVEETIGVLKDARCNGNNILLGNSSSIECNHVIGLKAILRMRPGPDTRVYVPLSYGEAWLRKKILSKGKRMLGNRFAPLTDFMSLDKYNQIIRSCSVAVMPHYRPQAFGNILTALWLGTRVYMSRKSPLYAFFKRIGAVVFCMEEDLKSIPGMSPLPLSDEETMRNRAVISSLYSVKVMHEKNMLIVRTLDS